MAGDWLALEGRRVAMFGAGAFGQACVRGLVDQGANVVVGDVNPAALAAVAAITDGPGRVALTVTADAGVAADCRRFVDQAAERLGGLDVVVHAVGINRREAVEEVNDATFDQILTTNLSSAFWLARAAIPHLRIGVEPKIVVFTSVSAWMAHPHHGAYAASKGGLQQLVKVLAVELAADGIAVNAVAPGYVETPLTSDYLAQPGVREGLVAKVPAGRLGQVDDVVHPVLYLSSPRSSFVTGHSIVVDGGRSLD